MRVILLKDIKGVGKKYEEKEISEGYATNFLIPKKLATPATGASAGQIKNLKESEAKHKEAEDKRLEEELHRLSSTTIGLTLKTNEKGHLFAKLTKEKISEFLKERGFSIPSDLIDIKESIREAGEHNIPVKVKGKTAHFSLIIN